MRLSRLATGISDGSASLRRSGERYASPRWRPSWESPKILETELTAAGVGRKVAGMTTTQTADFAWFNEVDDRTFRDIYLLTCCDPRPLRDEKGNLRSFTDQEREFQAAVRIEWKRRGLTV